MNNYSYDQRSNNNQFYNSTNEQFQQQQQQQQLPQQQQRSFVPHQYNNQALLKNQNDFLEQRGIPAISSEDMEIIRECGRESLFYRCMPITATLCAGLMYAARVKQFQPRYFHYLGAVFVGYFAGKLSYRSICEEKLIKSNSNSPFVQALRKRKGLFTGDYDNNMILQQQQQQQQQLFDQQSSTFGKAYNDNIGGGIREIDDNQYYSSSSYNQNKDTYIHDPFGIGSVQTDDNNNNVNNNDDINTGTGNISYDDLRNRNRSAFKNL